MKKLNVIREKKKPIFLSIILVLFLIEIFILHQYGINFNVTLSFTLTAIATLITAIATFALAFSGLRTIHEMRKQRKSAYKPDIMIAKSDFHVYNRKFDNIFLPVIWSNNKLDKEEISEITTKEVIYFPFPNFRPLPFYSDLDLECHNVGLGSAKYVEIEWHFIPNDFIEKIRRIERANNSYLFKISEEEDFFYLYFSKESVLISFQKSYYDSLPFIKKESPTKLPVPSIYLFLYSILQYLKMTYITREDIPPLELILKYRDMENEEFNKKFSIQFKIKENIISYKKEYKEVLRGIIETKKDETT